MIYEKKCKICNKPFKSESAISTLCSEECKRVNKHINDAKYRASEHGAAVRRKNRKNESVIKSRKKYEQTDAFKQSKRRTAQKYAQTENGFIHDRTRKLNYYYRKYSAKYGLYNPAAHVATLEEVKELMSATNCYYCGCELKREEKTIDHKLPVSKGGTNNMNNLVICCQHCNSLKNNKEAIA